MKNDVTVGKQKLASLFDSGTFSETGSFLERKDGKETGVVCGYGAINGKLAYAFAQDSDRQKGAFDALGAEKIKKLYDMALKSGAPVIGVFDSIGGYVSDGAAALSAYGMLLKSVSSASGVVPQIALISGVCSGLAATAAAMFDFTVTVKEKSKWFVNAPFLVGKDVGTAEYTAQSGLGSVVAKDEADAVATVRDLVDLLPSNCREPALPDETGDDVNRKVKIAGLGAKERVEAIADNGKVLLVGCGYADEMLTGLIRMGGICCGVVANNESIGGGALTSDGAKKAAKMVSFCDAFGIPVVTLTNSTGVSSTSEEEEKAPAAQLGKLAMAYATAKCAKVTVVVGKAYGASFTLMGSSALGADLVYALPEAEISVLSPEAGVAFLWNDQISETCTRASLEEKWRSECATPASAAKDGSLDDVISPEELRQRICSAVFMRTVERPGCLCPRHCNLPL